MPINDEGRQSEEEETRRMLELHHGGVGVSHIASAVDRSLDAVRDRLAAAGHPVRRRPGVFTEEQVTALAQEYEAGASIRRLAGAHGVAYGSVRRALLYAGVTLRPSHRAGAATTSPPPSGD
ncbi:helix-turn-helix domain-containing protein [Thermomonospora umbrina]|uniref:Helix-turn-helix domain-containing protein n=1 Tax=Thermomonospora umbrina TaxID=111806 RepID=A0A3D9SXT2_9ACTN|nr:helix-turn-helix domain-containing protein [Thermomonospora umbrina]REF00669.1 hypothetical protein DFJ69_6226 [Thermomonospora umbrina]